MALHYSPCHRKLFFRGQTPAVMLTGMRPDAGAPDAAALRQQRRLKQAIQFLHKDSADLLPLDGLKKLGTATQGVKEHKRSKNDDFLLCFGQEVNVLIDTGCKLNLMSSLTHTRSWSLLLTDIKGSFSASSGLMPRFLSKFERAGRGEQGGDGRVPISEQALRRRSRQGARSDHRATQDNVLVCHSG
uniref:Aspartic peptidase DDI1-type domain-containing protein n=1 Tax=Scophthalmus maximus TaxID=52904 RepID=A0A8D3BL14_SCOMX